MSLMAEIENQEPMETALTLYEQARSILVKTAEDYQFAGEFLRRLKDQRKAIQDWFRPLKEKADQAHKALVKKEKEALKPLEEAEALVAPAMIAWKREEERKAEEKARRIMEEARRREEEIRLAEAIQAEREGDLKAAQAILEEPIEVPVVTVQPRTPKISGLAERTTWTFRVVNESLIPREYMMPNLTKIGAVIRADKGKTRIPGVEVFPQSSLGGARR